jgi:hypothetical protein
MYSFLQPEQRCAVSSSHTTHFFVAEELILRGVKMGRRRDEAEEGKERDHSAPG